MAAVLPDNYDDALRRLYKYSSLHPRLADLLSAWAIEVTITPLPLGVHDLWELVFVLPGGGRKRLRVLSENFRLVRLLTIAQEVRTPAMQQFLVDFESSLVALLDTRRPAEEANQ